ncbi:unnamed protein product [Bursaphelenchus xylophilus]|uniref:Glucosylceramidase n=1 Tax=Bursaphelenchus xylophilus TaxID=6326 RepID=A0A7I8XFR7_BURXY|nr:unnamed protein product [Bursaphelenchus xylophilus]CAG9124136.1 unnamed protein product [Bursaphelenchus xylophilus]
MADAISTSSEGSQEFKKSNDFQIPEKWRTPLKLLGGLIVLIIIVILVWAELTERATHLGHRTYEDGCSRRYFGEDSFVCVCNGSYCDEIRPIGHLERNEAIVYETSAAESRLRRLFHRFQDERPENEHVIRVDLANPKHSILGFGGTLTDSAYFNLVKYTNLTNLLLNQFFGERGIKYNMLKVPAGSTEFSEECYTYNDKSFDYGLRTFSLENDSKVPFIKDILALNNDIKLLATGYSAPGWMKNSHKILGPGELKGSPQDIYYSLYTEYLIRYLEQTRTLGLNFWGISPLNEPLTSLTANDTASPRMAMSSDNLRQFINDVFGPSLKGNKLTKDVNIVFHEDAKNSLLGNVNTLYQDGSAFIDGFSVHSNFLNSNKSVNNLIQTHNFQPDKFILSTESVHRGSVSQGSWKYAADYASDIISSLNHYVNGYIDYNLALNEEGGPSLNRQTASASIIVNSHNAAEFYKQPSYYAIGHFSHFIPPGSKVLPIAIRNNEDESVVYTPGPIECLAVRTPEMNVVLILHNIEDRVHALTIDASTQKTKRFLNVGMAPKSIRTVVWRVEAE